MTVGGAMCGIILWLTLAAWRGIPTSESHALVAGLAGAGFATAGPEALVWDGWQKVLLGLVLSTLLGFFGGVLLTSIVSRAFRRARPGQMTRLFRHLQILSSGFMVFSHGSNDGQKFMGAFTLALVLGNVLPAFEIPVWVMFLCAAVMALGTLIGGWRVMRTMGMRIMKLETHQGFAAEMAAASTIELASRLGIPLSTTQTISTAIMGVGAARRVSAVRWGVTRDIVAAWILTFPVCGFVSSAVVTAVRYVL